MFYLCVTCQVALGTKDLATFCTFCIWVAGLVFLKSCLVWETDWFCRTFPSNTYVLSMAGLNMHQSPVITKVVFTQCSVLTEVNIKALCILTATILAELNKFLYVIVMCICNLVVRRICYWQVLHLWVYDLVLNISTNILSSNCNFLAQRTRF